MSRQRDAGSAYGNRRLEIYRRSVSEWLGSGETGARLDKLPEDFRGKIQYSISVCSGVWVQRLDHSLD